MLKSISSNFNTKFYQLFRKSTISNMVVTVSEDSNYKPLHNVTTPFETATFGMGCFWGADSLFGVQNGTLRTKVGYSGGTKKNPTYRDLGDHTEVISIDYDPNKITYNQLLDLFWNNHEYGLTNKIKRQYMSLILYHTPGQKTIAEQNLKEEQIKRGSEIIITEIVPAGEFYPAEDYHQKYRLQGHKDLVKTLNIDKEKLLTSHVAARLNGYLVGVGGLNQYLSEADDLGLNPSQKEYVKYYLEKNEGNGLFC